MGPSEGIYNKGEKQFKQRNSFFQVKIQGQNGETCLRKIVGLLCSFPFQTANIFGD